MFSDSRAVVVSDGQTTLLVEEVTDERGVKNEGLRTHLVAGHAFGEGGDFCGGEGY